MRQHGPEVSPDLMKNDDTSETDGSKERKESGLHDVKQATNICPTCHKVCSGLRHLIRFQRIARIASVLITYRLANDVFLYMFIYS